MRRGRKNIPRRQNGKCESPVLETISELKEVELVNRE